MGQTSTGTRGVLQSLAPHLKPHVQFNPMHGFATRSPFLVSTLHEHGHCGPLRLVPHHISTYLIPCESFQHSRASQATSRASVPARWACVTLAGMKMIEAASMEFKACCCDASCACTMHGSRSFPLQARRLEVGRLPGSLHGKSKARMARLESRL